MLETQKATSKLVILVEFSNLTFDFGGDMKRVSNVKFIPLEHGLEKRTRSSEKIVLEGKIGNGFALK
jgi:hypothetical protein